jgi:hypothetical protein
VARRKQLREVRSFHQRRNSYGNLVRVQVDRFVQFNVMSITGKVAMLKSLIDDVRTSRGGVDAVLVNEHHLSSAMHENLRREFGVPVIDR